MLFIVCQIHWLCRIQQQVVLKEKKENRETNKMSPFTCSVPTQRKILDAPKRRSFPMPIMPASLPLPDAKSDRYFISYVKVRLLRCIMKAPHPHVFVTHVTSSPVAGQDHKRSLRQRNPISLELVDELSIKHLLTSSPRYPPRLPRSRL